jgi:hypothetical protein
VVKINSKITIVAKKKLQKKACKNKLKTKNCARIAKLQQKKTRIYKKNNMQIQNIQKIIMKWSEINVVEGDISHRHSHLNAK